jgi:hypothetical protein
MPTPEELKTIHSSIKDEAGEKPQNNRFLFIIGGMILILIIVMSVYSIVTPDKTTIKPTEFIVRNVDDSVTRLVGVTYSGEVPDIPQDFAIARASQVVSTDEALSSLITQYGLLRYAPDMELWTNGPYYLSKDPYSDIFLFTLSRYVQGETLPVVQKDVAVRSAEEFMRELVPNVQLKPLDGGITYLEFGQEAAETALEKATAVSVPFAPTIDDIPVFYKKQTHYPFRVTVDGKSEVRKLVFLPQFQNYLQIERIPSISLEKAIDQIRAGQAAIINATYETDPLSLSDLKNAELTSVGFEYRDDYDQELVYPFFHFKGVATTTSGLSAQIEIITPAVAVDFNNQ